MDSLACVINPEYADHDLFDQVFDIFSTQSKTSAAVIEYQFGQLLNDSTQTGPGRNSTRRVDVILDYDSQKLNDSYDEVTDSIAKGYAVSQGFLLATMQAFNATGDDTTPPSDGANHATGGENQNQNSSNTALAM